MTARLGLRAARAFSRPSQSISIRNVRSFQTSSPRLAVPPGTMPVRKPVGAFRGGITGFLLGAVSSGAALYYYVIDEYKVSNELLTEDIYSLQAATQRIEAYVKDIETRVLESKK